MQETVEADLAPRTRYPLQVIHWLLSLAHSAPAAVATRDLEVGAVLGPSDLRQIRLRIALPADAVPLDQAEGRIALRPIDAGAVIRGPWLGAPGEAALAGGGPEIARSGPFEVRCVEGRCEVSLGGRTVLSEIGHFGPPDRLLMSLAAFAGFEDVWLAGHYEGDSCPIQYRALCAGAGAVSEPFGNCESLARIDRIDGGLAIGFDGLPEAGRAPADVRLLAGCRLGP